MAKNQDSYQCTECGWTSTRWVGKCGECQAWGTVVERSAPKLHKISVSAPASKAILIKEVPSDETRRRLTGIAELDRVLGGGLLPGAVVLLAGEPGVGKSTLLLEVAAKWAGAQYTTLYISGEESAAQVKLRAERTGAITDHLYLASENDLATVLGHIEQVHPTLLVLDSVQTITADNDGVAGGPAQVKEITSALARIAKREAMAVIIVGHVTKDGGIAGPRTLEHLVDVVLSFEGDKHSGFRMVRATKNRFGPADEVGCFEMKEDGIKEVPDPSGLFVSTRGAPAPGTIITATMQGRRPLLTEIQALVTDPVGNPRRTTHGLDGSRIAMVQAVLARHCGVTTQDRDLYTSTVGGSRVVDPSVDLAAALAITSAFLDVEAPTQIVAMGEIGLAGDIRRVPAVEPRLAEAARLGFRVAMIPENCLKDPLATQRSLEINIKVCESLSDAIAQSGLLRFTKGPS